MRRFWLTLACLLLSVCAPSAGTASQTPLLVDDFDQDATGSMPSGWRLARPVPGTSATVVEGTPPGNKWVDLHDDNAPGTTTNNTLSRTFDPVTASTGSGRVVAQFDVKLSQTTAGFGTRLTNGGVATSGGNWATALLFEGNIAYASGASPGNLSYQSLTTTYTLTPAACTYSANTWYSIRVEADVTRKVYKLFFGPQGGTLNPVTPTGGVPFIFNLAGGQVDQIGGISFYTSIKDGDAPGDLMIDNVNIHMDEPEEALLAATIAEARVLERGAKVRLTNKIVTAGSADDVFYMEDDSAGAMRTAGIRVRSSETLVQTGDRVDIEGRIAQSSEGNPSDHAGEREIVAELVTHCSSGNELPKPLQIRNVDIGGGWFGPMELLAEGPEPVIKGVWPYNAWGNTGVTSWVPEDNKMFPLSNIGLLVTVMGKVVEPTVCDPPGANYDFYVDDGSLVNDGWFATPLYSDEVFHPEGLRVRVTDGNTVGPAAPLHYGDCVKVTGIAGAICCSDLGRPSIRNVRVVRPRRSEDIEIIKRAETHVRFDAHGSALVAEEPFFPIGIFLYHFNAGVLAEVLNQGFNTVIFAVTPTDLDTLQANSLMTIPYPRSEWLAVKDHPSILAWYLADEPEGHGYTPAAMREEYEQVRAIDSTRPIGLSHFLWDALNNYRHSADFVISDVYPIGPNHDWPITPISAHIDRLHVIHGWNFPVWPAIQIFGGPDTEGGKWGIPTPHEARVMTYLALAHGAKGILYFSYKPEFVDTWAEVRVLTGELRQLTPFLVLPSTVLAATPSDSSIHTRCIQVGDSGILLAVNVSQAAVSATITIPDLPVTDLTLPFEGGGVSLVDGSFTASFAPYGVHVYQWGQTPEL